MTLRPAAAVAVLALACGGGDLQSPDPLRRAAAVRARSGGGERRLAVLLVAQRDPSPVVRAAAAEAFGTMGGPGAADALGKLLLDPVAEVAQAAARGLAAMPSEPRARAHLVSAYADATPAGRAAIAAALAELGVSLREAVEREARTLWERSASALEVARGAARSGAAEEMGASGRADAVQRLLPFVDPNRTIDPVLGAAAARALGESGDWQARPYLEALLAEGDAARAEAAALALGRLGDPAAADALAAGGEESARIGSAAADALAALPDAPEVGIALCDLAFRTLDPAVAGRAAREARRRDADCPERPLLAKLGRPGVGAALAALAERGRGDGAIERIAALMERAPESSVRRAAARALARMGADSAGAAVGRRLAAVAARLAERRARPVAAPAPAHASPEWIDAVGPEEAREAGALLAAAGWLHAPGAEPVLRAHLHDTLSDVRAGAVEGLGALRAAGWVESLAEALADPAPAVRIAAAEGLGRAGRPGAAPLAAASRSADGAAPEWRGALARALGDTGATDAIPALAALLDGPAAAEAAAALARIGAPAAAPPLVDHLARPDAPARPEAIEALAQLVAVDAAPALAALLTHDRPEVRAAAARALGRLRYEAASERLEALRSDYYGRVRRAAVEALAKLPSGMPRAHR